MSEFSKHRVRSGTFNFPNAAKHRELVVSHTHIRLEYRPSVLFATRNNLDHLISLDIILSDRLQFSCWSGI